MLKLTVTCDKCKSNSLLFTSQLKYHRYKCLKCKAERHIWQKNIFLSDCHVDNRTKLGDLLTILLELCLDVDNNKTDASISHQVTGTYKNYIRNAVYAWESHNHPILREKSSLDHTHKGGKEKYGRGWNGSNKQIFLGCTEQISSVAVCIPVANESKVQTHYALEDVIIKGLDINVDEGNAFGDLETVFLANVLKVKHKGVYSIERFLFGQTNFITFFDILSD